MNPFIFGFVIALQGLFTLNVTYAENIKPPKIIHKSLDTHKINISLLLPYDPPHITNKNNMYIETRTLYNENMISYYDIFFEICVCLFYICLIDIFVRLCYKIYKFICNFDIEYYLATNACFAYMFKIGINIFLKFLTIGMMINNIYINYIYKPYLKFIKPVIYYTFNIDDKKYEIIVVKNGKEIYKFKTMNEFKLSNVMVRAETNKDDIKEPFDSNNYDFVLQIFYANELDENGKNYTIKYDYFKESDYDNKKETFNLHNIESNRKFIAVVLKMNSCEYKIDICNPYYFNISENIVLEYNFLKWYMRKVYNVHLTLDYKITAIDNYVDMYIINPPDAIEICKNKYNKFEYTFDFYEEYSDSSSDSGYTIYNDEEKEDIIEEENNDDEQDNEEKEIDEYNKQCDENKIYNEINNDDVELINSIEI